MNKSLVILAIFLSVIILGEILYISFYRVSPTTLYKIITKDPYETKGIRPDYTEITNYYKKSFELKEMNILRSSILEREYAVTVENTRFVTDDPLNVAYLEYNTPRDSRRFEFSKHDMDIMKVSDKDGNNISFSDLKKGDKIRMHIKNDPYVSPLFGTKELTITVISE